MPGQHVPSFLLALGSEASLPKGGAFAPRAGRQSHVRMHQLGLSYAQATQGLRYSPT